MTKEVAVPTEDRSAEVDADQRVAPLPPPDAPPPTMPAEVRKGHEPPPPPGHAGRHRADGERKAGGIPPGTGPEVAAPLGTSEDEAPADGVHAPDVGPGGEDLDTATPPLASRPLSSRQPE